MNYTVGEEVRCSLDGRIGTVKKVDEDSGTYTVMFGEDEVVLSENEVC